MTKHIIVGRMGEADTLKVAISHGEVAADLQLLHLDKLDHGIGHAIDAMSSLKMAPTEIAVDILVLAAHVHAADTRISRSTESQDGWTREIRLVVPVSDPARWSSASDVLVQMLNFLTGDRWEVSFHQRPRSQRRLVNGPADLVGAAFDGVSLFSGGLDSLIGAIDALKFGKTPLLVSHAGEGLVSKSQELCFDGLKAAYPKSRFDRLRVWMSFESGLVSGVRSEESTRGRSFLFFSLGVAAGAALGKPFVLTVPENGLIALNVPLDPLRLGALSTRTTHPFYIARWRELIGVLGIDGDVQNPYWDKTKGEMVSGCLDPKVLKQLAPASLSCSSPTKLRFKKQPQGHCGYCLPCLIRRAAMLGDDATSYGLADLKSHVLDPRHAEGQQVRSFQLAVDRIARRPELAGILIHKQGPLSDNPSQIPALASVYERGLAEVGRLLDGVRTKVP